MNRHTASLSLDRASGPIGPLGESLAVAHLAGDDGFEVVARNWAVRSGEVRGELDAVALDHATRTVVVVEVKARRSERHGGPLVAVTPRKQAQVRRVTGLFLRDADLPYRVVRFDVIGLLLAPGGGRLEHLPGVF